MFLGEYSHSLDIKGRLAVPVKFRTQLQKGAVVTRGLDNCLFLYPKEEWKKLANKMSQLPLGKNDARSLSRMMLAGAMEVRIDKLGRILIPEYLRNFAFLNKKVIIAGLYNRIEIWDEEKWKEYEKKAEKETDNIAERLGELGV